MKRHSLVACIALFIFNYLALPQNHSMKISDSLRAHSEFWEAKRRSVGAAGKYEFGPYKIISGHKGFTTTKTKSKLFSRFSEEESKQKSSFVFTDQKDTLVVNISDQSILHVERAPAGMVFDRRGITIEPVNEAKITTSQNNFSAIISPNSDAGEWVILYGLVRDSLKQKHYVYALTDGTTEIELRDVNVGADGKTSMMWTYHGYEFFLNGRAVAAVQTAAKQYVWLANDLDPKMKTILAVAMTAMLFHDI
ncbi:MAG TPA: hypothetical protein VFP87_09370 [Chitinophagaceae bacterium]|nr:hypothetical protein [Chitinophagaceae bacterium]